MDCKDFDGQLAHPSAEVAELAKQFVCVRVTDMRNVDLARWRFDFDLTFAALTADSDGHVLHRYGGRNAADAESALSMASLAFFLRESRKALPDSASAPSDGTARPRTIGDLKLFAQRDAKERTKCVHCHMVNDFEQQQAVADGSWKREQLWVYPEPARIGVEVERDRPRILTRVDAGSPAAKAGLAVGDELIVVDRQRLAARADLQWVLNELPYGAVKVSIVFRRAADPETVHQRGELELAAGWKVADPLEYSWRPYKWNLSPQPGFGGKELTDDEKRGHGLDAKSWALRVNYLVDWGPHASSGRNALAAGLKKEDVVLSVAGKSDFVTEAHFQAWYRLTRQVGTTIDLVVLRDGKRMTVKLPVVEG